MDILPEEWEVAAVDVAVVVQVVVTVAVAADVVVEDGRRRGGDRAGSPRTPLSAAV